VLNQDQTDPRCVEKRNFAVPHCRQVSAANNLHVKPRALSDVADRDPHARDLHAARHAIDKAQRLGFAVVGVTNSWMSGRSAYYVEMIARADLVGIRTAAAARGVAPPGGIRPASAPTPSLSPCHPPTGPVVIDMGTSAFMLLLIAADGEAPAGGGRHR
jgi:hypothetical protein